MAPIAASSQSKSKLKAFQYEQNNTPVIPKVSEHEKENVLPQSDVVAPQVMHPPPQPLSQRSATKEIRDCPQTPIGKVPLADLLAGDDDMSRDHLNLTPVERVLWENSPLSSHHSSPITYASKSRKRAHSSSPTRSSQDRDSKHFAGGKPSVDPRAMELALETPKADPADDLWTRYSLNTRHDGRLSPTNATAYAFSQLLQSSSPPTPASNLKSRDPSGLRRALSCIEWPTSAAKRRKLRRGNYQDVAADLAPVEGEPDTMKTSKRSTVSLLIEKMHEDLSRPTPLREYPSSEPARSSPEARRHASSEKSSVSPQLRQPVTGEQNTDVIDNVASILSQTAVAHKDHISKPLVLSNEEISNLANDNESSDFGDDDIDFEILETVDAELKTNSFGPQAMTDKNCEGQTDAGHNTASIYMQEYQVNNDESKQNTKMSDRQHSIMPSPSRISPSTLRNAPSVHDEFDDDGNDVSAADLEDVFARYDSQSRNADSIQRIGKLQEDTHSRFLPRPEKREVSIISKEAKGAAEVTFSEPLSDDDFGSDSGFDQIAVECNESTQEQQQILQPQSSVCTMNFDRST